MGSISVILPAAGSSTRFGGPTSKIVQPLGGEPVFLRSIRLFSRRSDVAQVLLVVAEDQQDNLLSQYGEALAAEKVTVVIGGVDRSASVRNALAVVDPATELICVHDAVRPCISEERIDAVFAAAAGSGAAILAWPIHGTIKRAAADDTIAETIDRTALWQAQTPQVFRKDWLQAAYDSGSSATDDAALIEQLGHPVQLVRGDPGNIKITTPADLALAEAIIGELT
jgi:2-C-methyl-D-erythritol 4-phosphate cytidylyltransferase